MSIEQMSPSQRAPFLMCGSDVEIASDVDIGCNVVLYSGTRIGSGCEIGHGAIIGRPSRVSVASVASDGAPAPTIIGPRSIIGAYAIICAGVQMDEDAYVGDHALVREGTRLGARVSVGFSCSISRNVIIGDDTRLQGFCGFPQDTIIEERCSIGPYVVALASTFSDRDAETSKVVRIEAGSRLGSAVQLMPGVTVGSHSVVGTGSIVTRNVEPGAVVAGSPARTLQR